MRYLTVLMVTLITSCSWSWPFGNRDTGNCLDDDSCEGANPFEEQLVGGTWYCYGVSRNEPWDCSQQENADKIVAVSPQDGSGSSPSSELPVPADNFLDAFSDDAFVVQLIALQSKDEINAFASNHGLEKPRFIRVRNQESVWYVLILDVFNDRASADAAAAAWESAHNPSSKPWVRPVASLKAAATRAES